MTALRLIRATLLAAAASSALLASLIWASPASADGTGSNWSITDDKEFTNVPLPATFVFGHTPLPQYYEFLTANDTPFKRDTWRLRVRMPRHNAPSERVQVTITRSYTGAEQFEGDHIKLTYIADHREAKTSPHPTLAVYVECVIEDLDSGLQETSGWARIGLAEINPALNINRVQTLEEPIKGKGCKQTVDLGDQRFIKGARIELRGADDKHDYATRTVYLEQFGLYNGGTNAAKVVDKFTER